MGERERESIMGRILEEVGNHMLHQNWIKIFERWTTSITVEKECYGVDGGEGKHLLWSETKEIF